MNLTTLFASALGVLLLQACSSGPSKSDVLFHAEDTDFLGFAASNLHEGGFYSQASFDSVSEATFEQDLLEAADVIPIRATVSLNQAGGPGGVNFEIKESLMDPKLYLQDGTALTRVSISEMRKRVKKKYLHHLKENRFEFGILSGTKPEDTGYIYFGLPPDSSVDGSILLFSGQAGEVRSVDIRRSLLSFTYSRWVGTIEQLQTMNVGLQE